MSLCTRRLGLACRLVRRIDTSVVEIPTFLCPGVLRGFRRQAVSQQSQLAAQIPRRLVHCLQATTPEHAYAFVPHRKATLPLQCAGCGALSQIVDEEAAGFYSLERRSTQGYLKESNSAEEELIQASLRNLDTDIIKSLGFDGSTPKCTRAIKSQRPYANYIIAHTPEPPMCERCHNLKHHRTGVSIEHPTVGSLEDTILESPYKYNHIYHVVDAVDFPMSLVPGIHKLLNLTPQRSQNRRSKTDKFYHDKKSELSFVITRSDLLAPLKTQVDAMMPYLKSVLREALRRSGRDVRLGNVRCVSAKREWWTKDLKEDIWNRGGGGWMVGKVNVGKSRLFQTVFPKGRSSQAADVKALPVPNFRPTALQGEEPVSNALPGYEYNGDFISGQALDSGSLLPPSQPETKYPAMPLVSALPGTTASPIRVPFGQGKGELIDLPGLSRGDLELHVQPEHRLSLVMKSRIQPEQQVIKKDQSLLLGGFIRITPMSPDIIIMAYAFTPIDAHLTATEKAIGTQTQTRESSLVNISLPGVGEKIASAGVFPLKWDVTKLRTGPITASDAAGISVERLPYKVMSCDILIEGCGWVELVAQIRKKPGNMKGPHHIKSLRRPTVKTLADGTRSITRGGKASPREEGWRSEDTTSGEEELELDPAWPAVEVFTPEGRFVASRAPMNAWLYCGVKKGKHDAKGRPKKSMKGVKKNKKLIAAYQRSL